MKGRAVLCVAAAALAGAAAAIGAGYVFDGPGRIAFGFWAAVWGLVTFLVVGAVSLSLVTRRSGVRRVMKAVLALVLGTVAYGAWFFAIGTPLVSREGAWLWPLAIASLVGALWAMRGALFPRP